MWLEWLTPDSLLQDLLATGIAFVVAIAWLGTVGWIAAQGWVSRTLSRKIIHIGTGALFVLCWNFFSTAPRAPFLAASVPFVLTLLFASVGLELIKSPDLVASVTRSGDRHELLKGPLYYGLVFIACTVIYWRHSPIGILALMVMCGGDGLADIVGRRWGTHKLPFNSQKSWIGSAAMLIGSFVFGFGFLALFNALGNFQPPLDWGATAGAIALIAFVATLVEAIPIPDIDNITLTLVVLGLGHGLLTRLA
jgi:phytol kinase